MASPQSIAVAKYLAERFGGRCEVFEYGQDEGDLRVHVLECANTPSQGLTSYGTVGMSEFDNQLVTAEGSPLRVELVSAAGEGWGFVAQALATCAFNVGGGEYRCKPGTVFPSVFEGYETPVTTPHAFMWYPFFWEAEFSGLVFENVQIEWLQVVPITDAEMEYVRDFGAEALVDRLEAVSDRELSSLDRSSVA